MTYGATGAGKTFSLIGDNGDSRGILSRAAETMFACGEKVE